LFETCFRLIGAIERIEIERELDLRVAVQRRRQWHPLIDLVSEFRLLHRLIEIAKRQQRERMRGREIERELQVNESEIFAAAPAKRGAESIEHLGSARLRRVDHQWELLAGFELVHRFHDERMARQCFLECDEDLQSVVGISLSREKASISLNHAERRGVELIGAFEVLGCLLPLTGKVEDQRGMQLFEYRVPIGAGELVDG